MESDSAMEFSDDDRPLPSSAGSCIQTHPPPPPEAHDFLSSLLLAPDGEGMLPGGGPVDEEGAGVCPGARAVDTDEGLVAVWPGDETVAWDPWSAQGPVEPTGDPSPPSIKLSRTQLRYRRRRLLRRSRSACVDGEGIPTLPVESSTIRGGLPDSQGSAAPLPQVDQADAAQPAPLGMVTSTQRHNHFRRLRWASRRDASTAASFLRDLPPD